MHSNCVRVPRCTLQLEKSHESSRRKMFRVTLDVGIMSNNKNKQSIHCVSVCRGLKVEPGLHVSFITN